MIQERLNAGWDRLVKRYGREGIARRLQKLPSYKEYLKIQVKKVFRIPGIKK